ncbi:MAG: glycosyltransferase family 39 protein [Gordonia paraffinivorans]
MLTGAAWATVRILDDGRLRWAVLAGGLLGLAFLTKQLQALIVVPAIAVAYLVFAAAPVRRRIVSLVAALASLVVAAGWWVLVVELWPASSRPYIGGSQHNSIIELTVGYNGLGRVTGDEASGIGGAPGGSAAGMGHMLAAFGGHTGPLRMFSPAVGGQVAWLIPAALILGVVAIVLRGRAPRTDPERAALVFSWLWLASNALLMSYMAGIFHPYYTLAFAPPIAILVGAGVVRGWQARRRRWVRATLVATVILTAAVAVVFLRRTPGFVGWLSWVVVIAAVLTTAALVAEAVRPGRGTRTHDGGSGPGHRTRRTARLRHRHHHHPAHRGTRQRRTVDDVVPVRSKRPGGFHAARGPRGATRRPTTVHRRGATAGRHRPARIRQRSLPVVGGDGQLTLGGGLPTRDPASRHADRGLRRQRPGAHTRPVPGTRAGP